MRVKGNAVFSDRDRKIKTPTRRQDPLHCTHRFKTGFGIDRISVSSETKMLKRTKRGKRKNRIILYLLQICRIRTHKTQSINLPGKRSYVNHRHWHKAK